MSSITDILPCIQVLSNTVTVELTYDAINACDEPAVSPCHGPFIKKYHHFTYPRPGVVQCKYMKGNGEYQEEIMRQQKDDGMNEVLLYFPFIYTVFDSLLLIRNNSSGDFIK